MTPGYKAPKKVDLKTLQELDAEDESLVKYKATLLGQIADIKGLPSHTCTHMDTHVYIYIRTHDGACIVVRDGGRNIQDMSWLTFVSRLCVCFGRGWFSFLPACVYRNSGLKGLPAVHVHIKQSAKHTLSVFISADEGGPNVIVQQLVLEPVGHDSFTLDLTGNLSEF